MINSYIHQTKNWPERSKNFYFNAYLTEFGKYLPKNKNSEILDIGCGKGDFLVFLEKLGYKKLYGVEIDKGMYLEAKKKLKWTNLENVDVVNFLKKKRKFNLIFLIDVLEHIEQKKIPLLTSLLNKSLKKEGLVIIRTPNAESILFGTYMRYIDPTHYISFTRHSIKPIFEDKKFETVEIRGQNLANIWYLIPLRVARFIIEKFLLFFNILYFGETGFYSIQTPNLIAVFKKR